MDGGEVLMRLRIVHTTTHTYDGDVVASFNEARMTPLTTPHQTTLDARLEISPTATVTPYWDYWGTHVTAFDLHARHDRLVTTATSLVETDRGRGRGGTAHRSLSWDDLGGDDVTDTLAEFLAPTPRTTAPADGFADQVRDLVAGADPREAAHRICSWVHDAVEYVPGATGVHATAEESWVLRRGVCQDLAHLALAGLRTVGVPARYVSGYLHPRRAPEVGQEVAGESHAWIDFFDGAWTGWDPTNDIAVGDRHVVVARARDYSDVSPLQGVYSGPRSTVDARVLVTRVA
ncbi:transglutaminase family protein [Kineococcus rhizosphaerae]|uniref:Transglutaminase-like putative cysteine protease n=1 Tax=Kineococcus rhizosphaerae TaxID=559628 RepID=A0A2T0R7W9_9ACTN|nr:transglutaminase family protein [Kineococcus rhizosphaerae]PRY17240.1 transglutaminase-like putative cysteine protease [Kineococcus rhizosphaerae]